MSKAQRYNKIISFRPLINEEDKTSDFDLSYLTYNGKLTLIVEKFNQKNSSIEDNESLVQEAQSTDQGHTPLQIASFLNFSNIFLYLLTFGANPNKKDNNNQNTWHILAYRGHNKLSGLLLNFIRYQKKMEIIKLIDEEKENSGFSNLDIVKGKLSRAVRLNEENLEKFQTLQEKIDNLAHKLIDDFLGEIKEGLKCQDKNLQTPFHLAAMSKFPLCHKFINQILDFEFFKLDETWTDFLELFLELQRLETKAERMNQDPRKCLRLERELIALMGENYIKELDEYYKETKRNLMRELINIQDNVGDSILHISEFHGDFKIVSRLVFYGGNKKLKNNSGELPVDLAKDNFVRKELTDLNKAAKASDEKNIDELINYGEDINEKISIFWQAPIHKVIESKKMNKYEVLNKMLDLGSDPNIRDSNGWTALHYACQLGDLQSVVILREKGANIDAYSNNKRIPLHLAALHGYNEIVQFLLESGSDQDFQDELGCTPLHLAAKKNHVKCMELLLEAEADLYCLDFRSWNILHYASFHGCKKAVRFIAKYDADYDRLQNMRNSQNKLPIEIVHDPSVKPYFDTLFHAAKEGNLDLTNKLLNEKEDINEQTHFENNTPLHLAVFNNHYLEVKLLLTKGCDFNIQNNYPAQAYRYALVIGEAIEKYISMAENNEKDTIDLRIIAENLGINESMICKKNWNLKLWRAIDFNRKIIMLFEELGQIIKENEDEVEEGEEGDEKNEEIKENDEDDNENNAEDEGNNNVDNNNAEENNIIEENEK